MYLTKNEVKSKMVMENMDDEEKMRKLIDELKKNLKLKNNEIVGHLDKIDALEQENMRLQKLIPGD